MGMAGSGSGAAHVVLSSECSAEPQSVSSTASAQPPAACAGLRSDAGHIQGWHFSAEGNIPVGPFGNAAILARVLCLRRVCSSQSAARKFECTEESWLLPTVTRKSLEAEANLAGSIALPGLLWHGPSVDKTNLPDVSPNAGLGHCDSRREEVFLML